MAAAVCCERWRPIAVRLMVIRLKARNSFISCQHDYGKSGCQGSFWHDIVTAYTIGRELYEKDSFDRGCWFRVSGLSTKSAVNRRTGSGAVNGSADGGKAAGGWFDWSFEYGHCCRLTLQLYLYGE